MCLGPQGPSQGRLGIRPNVQSPMCEWTKFTPDQPWHVPMNSCLYVDTSLGSFLKHHPGARKRESFLWRTLNCLLWEALLTSNHLFPVFPLPFICFLSCALMLVLPCTFLLLFEPPESNFGHRCHDSLLLYSSHQFMYCQEMSQEKFWNPLFQFILKSWAFSPAGFS